MNNPSTRRHPRTLNEAFGPYCDNLIQEPEERAAYPRGFMPCLYVLCCLALALIWVTR